MRVPAPFGFLSAFHSVCLDFRSHPLRKTPHGQKRHLSTSCFPFLRQFPRPCCLGSRHDDQPGSQLLSPPPGHCLLPASPAFSSRAENRVKSSAVFDVAGWFPVIVSWKAEFLRRKMRRVLRNPQLDVILRPSDPILETESHAPRHIESGPAPSFRGSIPSAPPKFRPSMRNYLAIFFHRLKGRHYARRASILRRDLTEYVIAEESRITALLHRAAWHFTQSRMRSLGPSHDHGPILLPHPLSTDSSNEVSAGESQASSEPARHEKLPRDAKV